MRALLNKCYSRCHKATEQEKHLEMISGEGNVDSGLQVWLDDDGDNSTEQNGMETSGLCSTGRDKAHVK